MPALQTPLCYEAGEAYQAVACMGSHDRRPALRDGFACSYYCRQPAQADGLYFENVHGVSTWNVTIRYQGTAPWYGNCVGQDSRSSGINTSGVVCHPPVGGG